MVLFLISAALLVLSIAVLGRLQGDGRLTLRRLAGVLWGKST